MRWDDTGAEVMTWYGQRSSLEDIMMRCVRVAYCNSQTVGAREEQRQKKRECKPCKALCDSVTV